VLPKQEGRRKDTGCNLTGGDWSHMQPGMQQVSTLAPASGKSPLSVNSSPVHQARSVVPLHSHREDSLDCNCTASQPLAHSLTHFTSVRLWNPIGDTCPEAIRKWYFRKSWSRPGQTRNVGNTEATCLNQECLRNWAHRITKLENRHLHVRLLAPEKHPTLTPPQPSPTRSCNHST
jgi:hypothetical protein